MKRVKGNKLAADAMKKRLNKRFAIWAIVCVFVFAALAVAVNVLIPARNQKQVFDSTDLPSLLVGSGEERKVTEGQSGVLTYGPYITLQAGDYHVLVHYKTDSDTNIISSYSVSAGTFLEKTALPAGKSVYEFDLTLEKETPNVEVNVTYSGEGSLKVESIEFIEQRQDLRTAQWVLNVLLVLLFAALMVLDYFWEKIAWNKILPRRSHAGEETISHTVVQMVACVAVLAIFAVIINYGIPALNQDRVYDDMDFISRLVNGGEPRTVSGGKADFLTHGPYVSLVPGTYTLWLYYSTDTDKNTMDVICTNGECYYKGNLQQNQSVQKVCFSLDEETRMECRTWYSGEGYLSVDHMVLRFMRQDLEAVQLTLNILLILIFAGFTGYFLAKVKWRKMTSNEHMDESMILPWKNKVKESIFVALLLSFTFCISGPFGLYLSNIDEFWFSVWHMLPILAVAFVVITAFTTVILSLIPKRFFAWALALVFGLGVSLYIEGNFLVQDYGILNGTEIAWNAFTKWAVIDILIWIVIVTGSLLMVYFIRKKAMAIIRYASIFLVVLQIVALTITATMTPNMRGKSDYLLTTENITTISDKENIIVFMLDTFDTSYMVDFLEVYPEYNTTFSDFIFYPNTLTYGIFTHVATPYILTGVIQRNEVQKEDYKKLAFQYAPLYQTLVDSNYDIGVYTSTGYINYICDDKERQSMISNAYEDIPQISSDIEFLKDWMKLTAFRYFPHILKGPFTLYSGVFNELKAGNNGYESYNLESPKAYDWLQRELQLETDKNAFRFYHLLGTHPGGIFLNENAEVVGQLRTTLNEHIKGCFTIIENFIRQMKEAGVYDNSTIIICADHGAEDIAPYSNALFMVKPKDHHGEFTISNAPISYTDLLPTFMELLGEDGSQYGRSIFEIGEDEQRTRYFYRDMECDDGVWRVVEFRSDGVAGDPDSWTQIGPALDQLPIEVEPVGAFEESSQIYTVLLSNEATRHYQLTERPGDDLQVDLTLYSLTDQASHMVAYADGAEVFNGSVDPGGNASFALPDGVLADDVVELRFEFPEENGSAAHLIALDFATEQ